MKRNVPTPTAATNEGAPGLIKVVEGVLPKGLRRRLWSHRVENAHAKMLERKTELVVIRDAAARHAYFVEGPRTTVLISMVRALPAGE